MERDGRRRWTAEQKLAVLQEGRQTGMTVSEVCRRHELQPSQYYAWEKQAREGALHALRHGPGGRPKADHSTALKAEVERLRIALAEITVENLTLKRGPLA